MFANVFFRYIFFNDKKKVDFLRQYHELLKYVLENGIEKSDRTGVGTLSTFDLSDKI